ncbi:MAG: hypothetical protein V7L20_15790 [Nostoc sp.]|uniref:hypothetical protein n=1 Tax=Nostoc sp. TaxID=1180 RepID=UPI002FF59D98
MLYRHFSFLLSLCAIAVLEGNLPTQAQTTPIVLNPTTSLIEKKEGKGTQRVKLYYFRNAEVVKTILDKVKKDENWSLTIEPSGTPSDEIILYGTSAERKSAYRIIAAIDLPRPGIMMQMWGIQISSNDPKKLAQVMVRVQEEINQTQQLVRETYAQVEQYAKSNISENDFDREFKALVNDLGYTSALNSHRPLALTDIVIRMVAAETASSHVTKDMANYLMQYFENDERYKYYLTEIRKQGKQPLERFFSLRGLKLNCKVENTKNSAIIPPQNCWKTGFEDNYAEVSRDVLLDFALHYGHFVSKPDQFSPYYLQQSADVLNNRLQDTSDALNKDIEDFFVVPTLLKIQKIVSEYKGVEYAQVGRTSVASLSGITTKVTSDSVSAFDVTPPLRLSDLLTSADELTGQVDKFIPQVNTAMGKTPTLGSLPLARVISLVAALGEQQAQFRELKTGITLTLIPNVLRNMNSAELEVDLTIADPVFSGSEQKGSQEPLSRIGQQKVTTTVYTKAVDFFALSTFSNQSTLSGGRGYVPIIGTVWRGIFGQVPVLGDLFSWKRGPKNVRHESLLLTNSFITPTAMGVGLLYPLESGNFDDDKKFCELKSRVEKYTQNRILVEKSVCSNNYRQLNVKQ